MKLFQSMMKALLTLTLTFGAAQAGDIFSGAQGVTLLPINNDNITMIDEHVVIEGVPGDHEPLARWKTISTYHFRNETKEKQTITMGFPFPRVMDYVDDQPMIEPEDLEKMSAKEKAYYLTPLISSFTTKVRGADTKPKEIDIEDSRTWYRHAWVWDVTFEPGETVEVINTYEHKATVEDASTTDMGVGTDRIEYVLRTGRYWKGGKIGRLQLEVRPHTEVFLEDVECLDCTAPEPLKTTPEGARIVEDGAFKKWIWDLKDFAPDSNLYVRFITGKNLLKIYLKDSGYLKAVMELQDCNRHRLTRNAYYAWLGYPFKSSDLKDYFSTMPWYKENPDFDFSKLSKTNQEVLSQVSKIIGALEKKKGCRK